MPRSLRGAAVAALVAVAAVPALVQPARAADTARSMQWHLGALGAERANAVSTGEGVVVAVIDSGVDLTHPELRGQVLPGVDYLGGEQRGRTDTDGHGTEVAALIAGSGAPGGTGATGLAPGARILPVRFLGGGAVAQERDLPRAIRWAADHGADVINLSVSTGGGSAAEAAAVEYALSKDVVVVAGAGNTSRGDYAVTTPASRPGVVAVSATDRRGRFSSVSATGPEVALAAPGVRVVTATRGTDYTYATGTSASAALVSATAALIRAEYPELDAPSVIERMIRTARDEGAPGRDDKYGFGVVDPVKALTADVAPVTENPLLDPREGAAQPAAPSAAATTAPPASEGAATSSPGPAAVLPAAGDAGGGGTSPLLWLGVGLAGLLLGAGALAALLRRSTAGSSPLSSG
ncbi:type VII secretion-associated serine protease mycosin [Motilibacter aurantiacus]|uniref:type VII secretion-associated serine protease mycosin n=1 Tax=Motilibacter aurantiacus TaxID=2714955 RepID=UPI001409DFA7|nr:type VII secretion-associated serine protease mycosin [Motilibacter aurantiacus]NHC44032.1 type VII secretion-associated serine protease mycosin [Motilibacter aurantiacus]